MSNETVKIEIELPKIKGYRDVGLAYPKPGQALRLSYDLSKVHIAKSNFVYSQRFILEPEPWKPEPGEDYWTIDGGSIADHGLVIKRLTCGDSERRDTFCKATGLMYRTHEHANNVVIAIRDLIKSMPEPTDGL